MTTLDKLIAQISDPELRAQMRLAWQRESVGALGLAFEHHPVEPAHLQQCVVNIDSRVIMLEEPSRGCWRVTAIDDGLASCRAERGDAYQTIAVNKLQVVSEQDEQLLPLLLLHDNIQNSSAVSAKSHALIEADNYYALKYLLRLYPAQLDCIFIDPPYNTGASDWLYNNNYRDSNDSWPHSKWLSMMQHRLLIAKQLLKPDDSVLIATIDEHELHHLRMLLEKIFPKAVIQVVTVVINPAGVSQERFSRVEEYYLFCFLGKAAVAGGQDDLLSMESRDAQAYKSKPRWKDLLRSGTNARREDRPNLYYPVYIDEQRLAVVAAGRQPEDNVEYKALWPVRSDGSEGNWSVGQSKLQLLIDKGYVALGAFNEQRQSYGLCYLSAGIEKQVSQGDILIKAYDAVSNKVEIEFANIAQGDENQQKRIKTVWHRKAHDAGVHGSQLLDHILGRTGCFNYSKSLYAVCDALAAVLKDKPDALVLDFFAGSGTTLQAVCLLNAQDHGRRRCILVTNNEVAAETQTKLLQQQLRPGDNDWERQGICQRVTWPRCRNSILGYREDGSSLSLDYQISISKQTVLQRKFYYHPAAKVGSLSTAVKKREFVGRLGNIPQKNIKQDTAFIIGKSQAGTILFDEEQAEQWLVALSGKQHIVHVHIISTTRQGFDRLSISANAVLPETYVTQRQMLAMQLGFAENMTYWSLQLVQRQKQSLPKALEMLLPSLWLQAGARGQRPEATEIQRAFADNSNTLVFSKSGFAILLSLNDLSASAETLQWFNKITCLYVVSDDELEMQLIRQYIDVPHIIKLPIDLFGVYYVDALTPGNE